MSIALTGSLLALAGIAPTAMAAQSLDEYALPAPSAKGGSKVTQQPTPVPGDLPASVQAELAKRPDGQALLNAATSRELGAPGATGDSTAGGGDDDSSFAGAVVSSLGSPGFLLLLTAVVAMVVGAVALRRRSDRAGPGR